MVNGPAGAVLKKPLRFAEHSLGPFAAELRDSGGDVARRAADSPSREGAGPTEAYEIGPFVLNAETCVLTERGAPAALGKRAVAVLVALVRSAPEYLPKTRIIEAAWPGIVVEESNLAVQIASIRRTLARVPGGERWLETLSRRGYRFVGPVTRLPERETSAAGSGGRRSNLPEPLTSFVGRERELTELRKLLTGHRLLTLTGAGGVGKTRLALRVADAVLDGYGDGVGLVELAALGESRVIVRAVTNDDGRTDQPLIGGRPLPIGRYELRFSVGRYFAERGVPMSEPPFLHW